MARIYGRLAPVQKREGRHGANRSGLNLTSLLAGAEAQFDNETCAQMQRWAKHLLAAVEGFQARQRQRDEQDRLRLAALRKAVFHG